MKRRHVLAVLGLSFVTLGIYVIYWLYKTRKELLHYLPDKKAIPRVLILFIPILAMIGLVIGLSVITAALTYDSTAYNVVWIITLIVIMAGMLAIFVVNFWWFYRYFKAVEAVTQGNDAMLLYTLWIILTIIGLGPIWVLIVQNDLNKFIDNGHRPLKAPGYPGPGYQEPQQQWQNQPQQSYQQYPTQYAPQQQYPYQAPPAPNHQQQYPQYPQQQPEHHAHHESQQHPHHQNHPHHHNQGHHGHADQPHNNHDQQDHYQPPQQYQG